MCVFHVIPLLYSIMNKNVNVKIGKKIYQIRTEKKLSQQALADKIHYTQCKISRIETGDTDVKISELYAFAQALKTPVTSFLIDI